MNQGIRRIHQRMILIVRQSESIRRQLTAKNRDARIEILEKFGKIEMKLERLPQPLACFLIGFCAHQKIQRPRVSRPGAPGPEACEIPGCAGYEDRHKGSADCAEVPAA